MYLSKVLDQESILFEIVMHLWFTWWSQTIREFTTLNTPMFGVTLFPSGVFAFDLERKYHTTPLNTFRTEIHPYKRKRKHRVSAGVVVVEAMAVAFSCGGCGVGGAGGRASPPWLSLSRPPPSHACVCVYDGRGVFVCWRFCVEWCGVVLCGMMSCCFTPRNRNSF